MASIVPLTLLYNELYKKSTTYLTNVLVGLAYSEDELPHILVFLVYKFYAA